MFLPFTRFWETAVSFRKGPKAGAKQQVEPFGGEHGRGCDRRRHSPTNVSLPQRKVLEALSHTRLATKCLSKARWTNDAGRIMGPGRGASSLILPRATGAGANTGLHCTVTGWPRAAGDLSNRTGLTLLCLHVMPATRHERPLGTARLQAQPGGCGPQYSPQSYLVCHRHLRRFEIIVNI